MVRAENLVRKFRSGQTDIVALDGVNLEVRAGEFVAVIGRSGSGKSTLLYQLGLLDSPTSGAVYLDGRSTVGLSEDERTDIRLRELGYVFQDYALVPELTALENVLVPLLMQGRGSADARRIATEVLTRVGLQEKLRNLPNQLSGGEQQRVSIARAIAHRPKLIFADEPTANLDNETALAVLGVFQDLHREGQTIIMVTHEPEYAALTDRVVTLFDGRIVDDRRRSAAGSSRG